MVYDSQRGKVVLFGGNGFADTWEWDGNTGIWTNRTPANPSQSPQGRSVHEMAYDSQRGKVVLFGGAEGPTGIRFSDTWELDGNTGIWTNRTPSNPTQSPHESAGHAMAYDSKRGKVVVFGGAGLGDTWEWDGNTGIWTNRTPSNTTQSPQARNGHAMAYDSKRGKVVLFGGYGGGYLADTWEWDGNTGAWQQLTVYAPFSGGGVAMVYDESTQRLVLFGPGTWLLKL